MFSLGAALLFVSCGSDSSTNSCAIEAMTFNIRLDHAADSLNNWSYRKADMVSLLTYYSPTLFGMQEVMHHQLTYINEGLPRYKYIGVGRADGKEEGEYSPIFYDTTLMTPLRSGTFALSTTPEVIGSMGWDAACERIATWAIFKISGSNIEVAVFNTHFDHVGDEARKNSASLILDKIEEYAAGLPTVLMGDFNLTIESAPLQIIEKSKFSLSRNISPIVYGPRGTFHGFGYLSTERETLIDHIFVTSDIEVERYAVIDDESDRGYISDHRPVLTNLIINKKL